MVWRMEHDDIPYVFTAKAGGARNLHVVLCKQLLDFSLLFSSTATMGGFGIAAHSAANSSL